MKKILIVDDDEDILSLVEMILKMNHFEVETITRWEDIRSSIANFAPDLILLDVSLKGADGRRICHQLKESKETQHIPVIIFSANPGFGHNYEQWQANGFLEKPFGLNHLLTTIKFHLNGAPAPDVLS